MRDLEFLEVNPGAKPGARSPLSIMHTSERTGTVPAGDFYWTMIILSL